jgi:hypothetical protein
VALERADVDRGEPDCSPEAARLLGDRYGRRRREPLGLVGNFERTFAVDPRRLREPQAG